MSFRRPFDHDDCPGNGYVRAARRRQTAADFARMLEAEGEILEPAVSRGKAIASSFWGRAWCRAVESWQDYESRLPAGRSLLKNGAVIDLKLSRSLAEARVAADQLYRVRIVFNDAEPEQTDRLRQRCAGKLTSLVDLIEGRLSEEVISLICDPDSGLFPRYGELRTICNCIDDAVLCRHAAAALYAIAPRLDEKPELFFTLRGIDPADFFAAADAVSAAAGNTELSAEELSEAFGVDIEI